MPEAQYRQDFPETPGPAPEDEEACQQQETLDVGLTWAAVTLAEKNGIRAHLHEVFGKEMGEELPLFGNLQARRRRIHDDIRFVASESLAA